VFFDFAPVHSPQRHKEHKDIFKKNQKRGLCALCVFVVSNTKSFIKLNILHIWHRVVNGGYESETFVQLNTTILEVLSKLLDKRPA
jgi:hypothetical protein